MKKYLKCKKGSLLDWFFIIPVFFLAGVTLIISLLVIDTVDDSGAGIFSDNNDSQQIVDTTQSTLLNFDNFMLFVIVGLSIFTLVSAALVWNHPAFFFISFILLCIAVVVAAITSNAFNTFSTSTAINSTTAQLTKIPFLMDKLPVYVAVMGVLTAIVMYVAYRSQ